ncbi:MAG: ribosomal protein S18-alanine N-acetyltransferase [Erysipelotrichaceae bacterium]|nr:ribosomal protein S18-alanine N-acetyltransferase [Erysipelotrichaceae bacterium]
MIKIVKKDEKYFSDYVRLQNECFRHPYTLKNMDDEYHDNPFSNFLFALYGDEVVGYIDYLLTFNSATIMQICVDQKYRRKHIASLLLNEMENTFPKEGENRVDFVTLEVRKSNIAAQELYKKFNYELVTTKRNYYEDGEDALYMVKGV